MNAPTPPRDNRTAILLSAERLFAEHGLHGASLRQISDAAKQKNASAIQYHFGSRDQLVEAVFAHRMAGINPRRQARLDAARAAGTLGDIRTLVDIMVWPLAEELTPRADGNHYLQFLNRASHERLMALELTPPDMMTAWFDVVEHVRDAVRYLPDQVAEMRILLATEQCVSALAVLEATRAGHSREFGFKIETLIDMIAAGISAPVSHRTLDQLGPAAKAAAQEKVGSS